MRRACLAGVLGLANAVAAGDDAGRSAAALVATISFTMPRAATTSAGVYGVDGTLLRTLWSGVELSAGEHRRQWDGRDDAGLPVHADAIEIRVLHHRIAYRWEGVIGNSSTSWGGTSAAHRAYLPPSGVAVAGGRVLYAVGYNEGQPGLHGFAADVPGVDEPLAASTDPFAGFAMVSVDGARLYAASTGGLSRASFVAVFDLDARQRLAFPGGRPLCLNRHPQSGECYPDQDYRGVVDVQAAADDAPTGLAVQQRGRVLAVAHAGLGVVRLYDKTTGAALGELAVPLASSGSQQIAIAPDGDLWAITRDGVVRYTNIDRRPAVRVRIAGLARPLALAAPAAGADVVWVADGGASQQLKRFSATGRSGAVIGRPGGYLSEPAVRSDKLCFRWRGGGEQTAIAASDDGAVWVVDSCNNRMLRYRVEGDRGARSDAQVAYLPAVYLSTVDHARPRRVFANFLEFEVDDTAPLRPGESWRLVRNWLAGLPAALTDEGAANSGFGGLTTVETLANGRTYGIVRAHGRQAIVELPADGPLRLLRFLAAPLRGASERVMYEDGALGHALTGATTQTVLRQAIEGYDAAGDPVWARAPVAVASVPIGARTPHVRGSFGNMPPRFPLTAAGQVVFFDASVQGNEGFHLGAARLGASDWLWQASKTGPLDGKGSFQTKAIDGSVHYGGNVVWSSGTDIVYGYHGEFFRDPQNGRVGQASQFVHYHEDGLFLGQFGQPSTRPAAADDAGLSGNAFSPTLVRDGTRLYLYHNDEWAHGGVHRWRIDGADDVRELRGRGRPGEAIVLR